MARLMALDWGQARVGVAIADELGICAHPRGFLAPTPPADFAAKLKELCEQEAITGIVVGLPLDMSGGEGQSARASRAFAQRVADLTGLEVELVDERWSSKQAEHILRTNGGTGKNNKKSRVKQHIDATSAALVLQGVLDRNRRDD